MKKSIALFLVVLLVNAMGIEVCAHDNSMETRNKVLDIVDGSSEEPTTWLTNISYIKNSLSVNASHTATINCGVTGYTGVTKTTISATLQKKSGGSWINVKTWTASSASKSASMSRTKSVTAGQSSRVKAVSKAYKGNNTETKTTYSSIVTG